MTAHRWNLSPVVLDSYPGIYSAQCDVCGKCIELRKSDELKDFSAYADMRMRDVAIDGITDGTFRSWDFPECAGKP
jgi:hypothetical protein